MSSPASKTGMRDLLSARGAKRWRWKNEVQSALGTLLLDPQVAFVYNRKSYPSPNALGEAIFGYGPSGQLSQKLEIETSDGWIAWRTLKEQFERGMPISKSASSVEAAHVGSPFAFRGLPAARNPLASLLPGTPFPFAPPAAVHSCPATSASSWQAEPAEKALPGSTCASPVRIVRQAADSAGLKEVLEERHRSGQTGASAPTPFEEEPRLLGHTGPAVIPLSEHSHDFPTTDDSLDVADAEEDKGQSTADNTHLVTSDQAAADRKHASTTNVSGASLLQAKLQVDGSTVGSADNGRMGERMTSYTTTTRATPATNVPRQAGFDQAPGAGPDICHGQDLPSPRHPQSIPERLAQLEASNQQLRQDVRKLIHIVSALRHSIAVASFTVGDSDD